MVEVEVTVLVVVLARMVDVLVVVRDEVVVDVTVLLGYWQYVRGMRLAAAIALVCLGSTAEKKDSRTNDGRAHLARCLRNSST